MKKIILILFLFLSCYLIYHYTDNKEESYLLVGNLNINEYTNTFKYNNNFVNENYRIIDLINIIKYNEELEIDNKKISIHRLLKKSDYLILSIGMNDIYYKLNLDTKNIYTYVNDMVKNMNILLSEISKYSYQKVIVLGYYNINNKNNDIFSYLNYKMQRIVKRYNYDYIDLNTYLRNNQKYYQKSNNFTLNKYGYAKINEIIVENLKKY